MTRTLDRQDASQLAELLGNTATTEEVLRGLFVLGLSTSHVATATGASVSAVRNWLSDGVEPRADAAITLDDLRTVARILLDGGMEPARIGRWLTRRSTTTHARPLDEIASDPTSVIDSALRQAGLLVVDGEPAVG